MTRPAHAALLLVLAATAAAAAEPGTGGLAGLPPDDVKTLRRTRDALQRLVEDTPARDHIFRDALGALARVHEALDDWGTPGQLDWYLALLTRDLPDSVQAEAVRSAQAAARGRAHHLGNVRQLWSRLDTLAKAGKLRFSSYTERYRKTLGNELRYLARGWPTGPTLKPLIVPKTSRIEPGSLLKPFKEPRARR